jgi:hypothetical protein
VDKDKVYQRYVSVLNLVERGAPGEKENAHKMKSKMEQQNPWLLMYHQESNRQQTQPRQGNGFDWGHIFNAADQIFNTFKDFSEQTYGMQRARLLADQCVLSPQTSSDGSLKITIVIPNEVRNLLKTVVTEPQKDAFMETIMNRAYSVISEDVY